MWSEHEGMNHFMKKKEFSCSIHPAEPAEVAVKKKTQLCFTESLQLNLLNIPKSVAFMLLTLYQPNTTTCIFCRRASFVDAEIVVGFLLQFYHWLS